MYLPNDLDLPTGGPWVATWCPREGLRVNGDRWRTLPRDARWARRVVYLVGPAPWLEIGRRYLDPSGLADLLRGPRIGKPSSMTWTTDGGGMAQLVEGDAWGLPANPLDALDEIHRLADVLRHEEALAVRRWPDSAASLAGALARRCLGGKLRQLRPRWRGLARAGYHTAPQLALTGGGRDVIQVDRVAAYLSALWSPMPVPGSWATVQPGARWDRLRKCDGFALAAVEVLTRAALPPLPVRHLGGTAWPVGAIVGAWPLAWLRAAESSGEINVRYVLDAQICRAEPWLADLGDRIAEIEDSKLRKLVYTRLYGVFAAARRWTARHPGAPLAAGAPSWAWRSTSPDPWAHTWPPTYRPDVAAHIAAHNAIAVLHAIRQVPIGAVHLAHVDALWVNRDEALRVYGAGGWAVKAGAAPLRVYGAGTYLHGRQARAQGQPDAHDPDVLAQLVADRVLRPMSGADAARIWTHGGPMASAEARSYPCAIRQAATVRHIPSWARALWGAGNWRARGTDELSFDELALDLPVLGPVRPPDLRGRLAELRARAQRIAEADAIAEAQAATETGGMLGVPIWLRVEATNNKQTR